MPKRSSHPDDCGCAETFEWERRDRLVTVRTVSGSSAGRFTFRIAKHLSLDKVDIMSEVIGQVQQRKLTARAGTALAAPNDQVEQPAPDAPHHVGVDASGDAEMRGLFDDAEDVVAALNDTSSTSAPSTSTSERVLSKRRRTSTVHFDPFAELAKGQQQRLLSRGDGKRRTRSHIIPSPVCNKPQCISIRAERERLKRKRDEDEQIVRGKSSCDGYANVPTHAIHDAVRTNSVLDPTTHKCVRYLAEHKQHPYLPKHLKPGWEAADRYFWGYIPPAKFTKYTVPDAEPGNHSIPTHYTSLH